MFDLFSKRAVSVSPQNITLELRVSSFCLEGRLTLSVANNKVMLPKTTEKPLIKTTVFPPQSNQAGPERARQRATGEGKGMSISPFPGEYFQNVCKGCTSHGKKKYAPLYFVFLKMLVVMQSPDVYTLGQLGVKIRWAGLGP